MIPLYAILRRLRSTALEDSESAAVARDTSISSRDHRPAEIVWHQSGRQDDHPSLLELPNDRTPTVLHIPFNQSGPPSGW